MTARRKNGRSLVEVLTDTPRPFPLVPYFPCLIKLLSVNRSGESARLYTTLFTKAMVAYRVW